MGESDLRINFRFRTEKKFYPNSNYVFVNTSTFSDDLKAAYNASVQQAQEKGDPIQYVLGINIRDGRMGVEADADGMIRMFDERDVDYKKFIEAEIIDKKLLEDYESGKKKRPQPLIWGSPTHA